VQEAFVVGSGAVTQHSMKVETIALQGDTVLGDTVLGASLLYGKRVETMCLTFLVF
jgi:hypothetical protein